MSTEGIFEAAKAHYAALSRSGIKEMQKRFKAMDSNGDGKVSYSDYFNFQIANKIRYDVSHLFNLLDKNGDGVLDFDEYITFDFIHNSGGCSWCDECSVPLLGVFFVCVKCRDAGIQYDLCCKCYGGKSYNHFHYRTDFIDLHRFKLRKPKPASKNQEGKEEINKITQQVNEVVDGFIHTAREEKSSLEHKLSAAVELLQKNEIPPYFICPISQEIMEDPHFAADGFTYELEAIKGWMDGGHDASPMTNIKLPHCNLVPNRALRSAIQECQHR